MRVSLSAIVVVASVAVVPAGAHHPFAPYYDASKQVSITGVVAELRAVNPHIVVIVEGTAPDGRSGRWAFEGFPPNAFVRRGIENLADRLATGARITITGWAATDPQARAFSGREITFADGSTLLFGSMPEENRWSCSSPCPYRYPDVRPR